MGVVEPDRPIDVVLVNPHYVRRHGGGVVPPIGLCYLAGALRANGAGVKIIDLAARFPDFARTDDEEPLCHLASLLDACRPTLIGIGPLVTATLKPVAALAQLCRAQTQATLVVGGPLCALPGAAVTVGELIDYDWIVGGDGETPIVELWRGNDARGSAARGDQDPTIWREPDLDALPTPARDLLDHDCYVSSVRRTITGASMTAAFLSRGCPYSCSFCAAPLSSGKLVRRLSMSRVAAELDACARLGYEEIIFYDDCLFVRSPKLDVRVAEFTDAVARSDFAGSYQLELRCDAVMGMSDATLRSLASSGCRQINMGIEKGHTAALSAIRKRLTPEIARMATSRVVEAGMRAAGTFILGGPGESRDDLDLTASFAASLDLDFAHFNPLALYPGTAMFEDAYPDGRWLDRCLDRELAPFGDILWRSPTLPLQSILESVQTAYGAFYSDERLARVAARLPEDEREAMTQAYGRLRSERSRSWRAERTVVPELAQ